MYIYICIMLCAQTCIVLLLSSLAVAVPFYLSIHLSVCLSYLSCPHYRSFVSYLFYLPYLSYLSICLYTSDPSYLSSLRACVSICSVLSVLSILSMRSCYPIYLCIDRALPSQTPSLLTCSTLPRASKYPIFEVSGSKNHTLDGFLGPETSNIYNIKYLDPLS